jgi:DNA-binding NarL/FixJ family response regulator
VIHERAVARIRVVIADHDPSIREILIDLVTAQPSLELVRGCDRRRRAFEICREAEPDVALMDVRMSGTVGVGAVRRIRQMGSCTRVVDAPWLTIATRPETTYAPLKRLRSRALSPVAEPCWRPLRGGCATTW